MSKESYQTYYSVKRDLPVNEGVALDEFIDGRLYLPQQEKHSSKRTHSSNTSDEFMESQLYLPQSRANWCE